MAYDSTNQNWEGTGGTEAAWRKRYPTEADNANAAVAAPPPAPAPGPAPVGGGLDRPNGGAAPAAPNAAPAPAGPPAINPADPFQGNGVQIAGGGWVPKDHPLAQPVLAAQRAAAAAQAAQAPAATPGAPAAPAAPTGPAAPTIASTFQDALIKRLNPEAVSVNSASIQPALKANKLAEARGFENNRNMLAERAAANGTNGSGGFETALLGLGQDRAGREAQFAGNAVTHAQDQQEAAIMNALGIGGAFQAQQQDADIRRAQMAQQGSQFGQQLAQSGTQFDTDAELRRQGISNQYNLGQSDLALRGRLGDMQSQLGLLSALMSNDQFGRQLSQNGAQFGANLDQSGILGLLAGLG